VFSSILPRLKVEPKSQADFGRSLSMQRKTIMKFAAIAAIMLALIPAFAMGPNPAEAKGCLKGAVVGGVAGHYAGHHGVMGAIGGCVVGHHMANEKAKDQAAPQGAQNAPTSPTPN
jgi:hypothetical protein